MNFFLWAMKINMRWAKIAQGKACLKLLTFVTYRALIYSIVSI
jgi:hypothetical protein